METYINPSAIKDGTISASKIDETIATKSYVDTQIRATNDKLDDFINAGYLYAGIATPEIDPGTLEAKVFYIANGKGTYTNFGGLEVTENEVVVLYYDTGWHKVATGMASQAKLSEVARKVDGIVGVDNIAYKNPQEESGDDIYQYANLPCGLVHKATAQQTFSKISVSIGKNALSVDGKLVVKKGTSISAQGGEVICEISNFLSKLEDITPSTRFVIDLGKSVTLQPNEYLWIYASTGCFVYRCFKTAGDGRIPMYFNGSLNTTKYSTAFKLFDYTEGVLPNIEGRVESLEVLVESLDVNELKYSKAGNIYDIMNYGLYVDIIPNKKMNTSTGEMEESSTFVTTTLAPLDREHPICLGINGTTSVTCFFDKDKRFISSLTGKYLNNPINVEEFPVNAEYIAFSYNASFLFADKFFTRRDNLTQHGYQYSKTRKLKGARPVINIYKSDSEIAILEKLIDAYLTQDCDVMWEHGEYSFYQVYLDIVDVCDFGRVQGSYQRELPIGGNCHYYFNGSIVTGSLPAGITDAKVFGNIRTDGQPFELHDGKIISDGMVYCVHDEGQEGNLFFSHKYYNMKMTCNGGSRCIGAGTGKHGILVIEGCEFRSSNPSVTDVAVHGVKSSSTDEMDYIVSISNSYFSVGVQVNILASNQVGELRYCGNSAKKAPIATDGWVLKAWGNEIR